MNIRIITIFALMFSTNSFSESLPLLGTWKSNEAMTLVSMSKVKGITEEAKVLFEKDFFGKVILSFRKNDFRSYIPGETDDLDTFNKYQPFKIIDATKEYIELQTYTEILQESMSDRFYFEGECIYIYTSKWKFKEYFCRYNENL